MAVGLGRTILRPVAYLAGRHAARQLAAFGKAHLNTDQVQQRLLEELLAAHADTSFGRDHGFASIRSYEDFVSAVPLQSYETLRPYMDRVFNGQRRALLPAGADVLMFSMTSGTTGRPKHIPVTQRFLDDIRRGWNIFGIAALRDHPEAWLRPILQITSAMNETTSPTGIPCGAISGLLAATQKRIVRRMYTTDPQAAVGDPQAKYYTIMRCAVGRDVAFITTANPSSTVKLIETAQAHSERLIRDVANGTLDPPGARSGANKNLRFKPNRALARRMEAGIAADGELLPRHFWDIAFLANWTGGTLGLYLPRLRQLFDSAPIRDIGLLASEGRLSIPLSDATPAGVAEITSNFLEFIPAEDYEQADPPTLRAQQVEIDREYFIVTSNWAGLWRYSMDDRVRVVGRMGRSPVFQFLSRGKHTANITGEKITEHQVVEAMRRAGSAAGLYVRQFELQGRFAPTPYYELRVPLADDSRRQTVARLMDEALGRLNIEYQAKRASGRLGPIRAIPVNSGRMDEDELERVRLRNGRAEQYKHQYLLTDIIPQDQPGARAEA